LAEGATTSELQAEARGWTTRISALLRADGLPRLLVERLTRDALGILEHVLVDRDAHWILSPHPRAASEFSLTTASTSGDGVFTVRADRIFNAGSTPHAPGDDFLWIIDYKTSAHGSTGLDTFLQRQREAYAEQLQTYARILAPALGKDPRQVRVGLYFPAIPRLLWWDPTAGS
jgi:hypothetical protein